MDTGTNSEVAAPEREGRIRRLPAWAYQAAAGRRDVRLDFLRGWCIFSMVVDHAADQRSSPLFAITGNGPWPMTGAHGFVLLSGVVIGLLYSSLIGHRGFGAGLSKLGRRGLKLYAVAVALGLFDIAWRLLPWGGGGVSLQELPPLVTLTSGSDDLMTFYFMMVLLAAPVLLACHRRLWPLALAGSVTAWLVHNHDERLLNPPLQYFVPVADWQLLFVVGVLIGYHRSAIGGWLQGGVRVAWIAAVMAVFALTLAVQSELAANLYPDSPAWLATLQSDGWQGYDHNPPLHMALVFGNLFAIYYLVTWAWAPLASAAGWFFIPLGQAALYVYFVHQVLVYYVLAAVPLFGGLRGPLLTASLLGLMLLIWMMVKRRFLFSLIPR